MCDCLVALAPATAAGVTLFAKNSDRPPTEVQDVLWSAPRQDTGPLRCTWIEVEPHLAATFGTLLFVPRWGWGAEMGVNERGVAVGNETIYTTLDPRGFPPALTGMDLVRIALERAGSAAGAVAVIVDAIDRHGQGGSGHRDVNRPYWSSFLVADPNSAFVVETSGRTVAIEQVEDVRAISNRTTIPTFDAEHRHPRQPVERLVDPRWQASQAVLAGAPVTRDALVSHLSSHAGGDDGWTVCMHVEGVEATTASLVAELPVDGAPVAWCSMGSPCAGTFTRVVVGEPLPAHLAQEAVR
jgi:secernin